MRGWPARGFGGTLLSIRIDGRSGKGTFLKMKIKKIGEDRTGQDRTGQERGEEEKMRRKEMRRRD